MTPDSLEIEIALRLFRSGNPRQKEGFERLDRLCRSYVEQKASHTFGNEIAREASQRVFIRIWDRRDALRFDTSPEWLTYLFRSVRHTSITLAREGDKEKAGLPPGPDPDPNPDDPVANLAYSLLKDNLWKSVTELAWFGDEPADAGSKRILCGRVRAGKLRLEDAIRLAAMRPSGRHIKTADDFEEWVGDTWVIRAAAYDGLYFGKDRLARHLIGEDSIGPEDLDRLTTKLYKNEPPAPRFRKWNCEEAKAILLRFRVGDFEARVKESLANELEGDKVTSLFVRCLELFPFVKIMTRLWEGYREHRLGAEAFLKQGLWKKLFAEYRYIDLLPQEDCLDRTHPASQVVGDVFTPGDANMWTSGGRLRDDLKRAMKKKGIVYEV